MKLLVHALRVLLALGVLLPPVSAAPGSPGGERQHVAWSVAGPRCVGLSNEGRSESGAREARPDERLDGDAGPDDGACAAGATTLAVPALGAIGATFRPFGMEVRGVALAARAYLRVNGSANANGARA